MSALNRGLPRLAAGLLKREREAWQRPCALAGCGEPAAALIDTLAGPKPVCARHIAGAERLGYHPRRKQAAEVER